MISVIAGWPEASIVSREVRKELSNGETRVKGSGRDLCECELGNDLGCVELNSTREVVL